MLKNGKAVLMFAETEAEFIAAYKAENPDDVMGQPSEFWAKKMLNNARKWAKSECHGKSRSVVVGNYPLAKKVARTVALKELGWEIVGWGEKAVNHRGEFNTMLIEKVS